MFDASKMCIIVLHTAKEYQTHITESSITIHAQTFQDYNVCAANIVVKLLTVCSV